MSDPRTAELLKRNRKLQAILGQRELTQDEKDEWEELVRQMNELQSESPGSAE
jgi:hypothetical protein